MMKEDQNCKKREIYTENQKLKENYLWIPINTSIAKRVIDSWQLLGQSKTEIATKFRLSLATLSLI